MSILTLISGLVKPVTDLIKGRQDRKKNRESAQAQLSAASQAGNFNLKLKDQEWEALAQGQKSSTWTDEYATVSILSIVNLVVVGGVASAFGYPQVLTGIVTAISTMAEVGIDIGFLAEAVVLAAIGLSTWRKL